ncbi:MAG: hypothetical protein WC700_07600 [Gemmatimonadaceae bacterium]|jgi:hypothetical protein
MIVLDDLPTDLLTRIAWFAADYSPALRAVSRRWLRVVRRARWRRVIGPPCSLDALADSGHEDMLRWVYSTGLQLGRHELSQPWCDRIFTAAARLGDIPFLCRVESTVGKDRLDLDAALAAAASRGHLLAMDLLFASIVNGSVFPREASMVNKSLIAAVGFDQSKSVLWCLEHGKWLERSNLECARRTAAWRGRGDILELLTEGYDSLDFPSYAKSAAGGGHVDLLKRLLQSWTINILTDIAENGAQAGNMEIVQLCLDRGLNSLDSALVGACRGGHKDLAVTLYSMGATSFDEALIEAASQGHEETFRLCVAWGASANSFDVALRAAARGGHGSIVRLCCELGATDFDWAFAAAAEGGHKQLLEFFYDRGVTSDALNIALGEAALNGHVDVMKMCHEWGATNFHEACNRAVTESQLKALALCLEWGMPAQHMDFTRSSIFLNEDCEKIIDDYLAYLDRSVASVDEIIARL